MSRRIRLWLLEGFFLLMIFFTILSRMYDSMMIPQVDIAYSQRKQVMSQITGTGTILSGDTSFLEIYPGCRVASVQAVQGAVVKTGDEIFRYQLSSLLEKKEELNVELEKRTIDLEKERISSETYPNVTQEELALQEAAAASLELEQGKADYEEAWADYHDRIKQLKQEYERKSSLTEDELWNENQRQYIANRNSLDAAKSSMEEAVREAERTVDDARETLEQLQSDGASEEELAQAEKILARAREDAASVRTAGELQVDSARDNLEFASELMDRIDSGTTTSQIALKDAYEEQVKQEEKRLQEAADQVTLLEKGLAKANQSVANARKSDTHTALTNQQKERLSQLTQKAVLLDIHRIEKELQKLDELIGQQGIVTALKDGTLVKQDVKPGIRTSGEELVELASGAPVLEGTFDKENQNLAAGDGISVSIPGSSRKIEASISTVNLMGEEGSFRAELAELEVAIGALTSYQCRKQSDIYQQVIPIGGLRKDNQGYYVLVAQAAKTILGEEMKAVRKEVSLLYHGDQEAAVEGSLLEDDMVIIKSNKIVNAGERVRVMNNS